MTHPCPVARCSVPASDDRRICSPCGADLQKYLAEIPAHARQLELSLARQTASAGSYRPRGHERPLPYDQRASEALGVLKAVLVGRVRDLAESGAERHARRPVDTVDGCALWLLARLDVLVVHPAAECIVDEIAGAVRCAVRAIDRAPVRVYAGPCGAAVVPISYQALPESADLICNRDLYAIVGDAWVRCTCGAEYDVAGRRTWLLEAARDVVLAKHEILRAIPSLLGEDVKDTRFRQWLKRGRLHAHGLDVQGRETYRVGDVLDLMGRTEDVA